MKMSLYRISRNGILQEEIDLLYDLLRERTEEQSISHKEMPSKQDHKKFVLSDPYKSWMWVDVDEELVGSCYLTHQHEIGIHIFKEYQGNGYGKEAVKMLMKEYPGRHLANINPNNPRSIRMFEDLGFKHIQNTYAHS